MFKKAQVAPIPDFHDRYRVTASGGIFSRKKDGTIFRLRPATNHWGYFYVTLEGKKYSLHGIIARAFLGPRPSHLVVNHKDGNKKNNAIDNLEYCTHSENSIHAHKLGLITCPTGDNHWSRRMPERRGTKINIDDAKRIKYELSKTMSWRNMAKMFGVTKTCIGHIIGGKTWKHI
jgi:hypothetical protein